MHTNPAEEKYFRLHENKAFGQAIVNNNKQLLKYVMILESLSFTIYLGIHILLKAKVIEMEKDRMFIQTIILTGIILVFLFSKKFYLVGRYCILLLLPIIFVAEIESHYYSFSNIKHDDVAGGHAIQLYCISFVLGGSCISYLGAEICIFMGCLVYLGIRTYDSSTKSSMQVMKTMDLVKCLGYYIFLCYYKTKTKTREFSHQFSAQKSHEIDDLIFQYTQKAIIIVHEETVMRFNQKSISILEIDTSLSVKEKCASIWKALQSCQDNESPQMNCCICNGQTHKNFGEVIRHFKSLARSNPKLEGGYRLNFCFKRISLVFNAIPSDKDIDILIVLSDITNTHKIDSEKANFLAKTKLLGSMSHNLKTPIYGVVSCLFSLRNAKDTKTQVELTESAYSSAAFLWNYIHNVVDLLEIEAGEFVLALSNVYIREIVDEVLDLVKSQAKQKKILIKSIIDPKIPQLIILDRQRVVQILTNIVSNAVQYTVQGQVTVKLSLKQSPSTSSSFSSKSKIENEIPKTLVKFKISDTGIGIPAADLNKIFRLFHESLNNNNDDRTKAGLKLAITKKMIEKMKGSIKIKSSARGTHVTFYLPINLPEELMIKKEDLIPLCGRDSHHRNTERNTCFSVGSTRTLNRDESEKAENEIEKNISILESDMERTEEKLKDPYAFNEIRINLNLTPKIKSIKKQAPPSVKLRQSSSMVPLNEEEKITKVETASANILNPDISFPKICNCPEILIVDDNTFNLLAASSLFKQRKISTQTAISGEEAIRILKERNKSECCKDFRLILMDCNMPKKDGFQTTIEIRKLMEEGKIKTTPIVGHSAFSARSQITKCFQVGMTSYVKKPLDIHKVETLMKKYFFMNKV